MLAFGFVVFITLTILVCLLLVCLPYLIRPQQIQTLKRARKHCVSQKSNSDPEPTAVELIGLTALSMLQDKNLNEKHPDVEG